MKELKEYKVTAREVSVNSHGLNFLCVFGSHINGGYIAIVNWGVCTELSAFIGDERYNSAKILQALERSPDLAWLPKDSDLRNAISRDIAAAVTGEAKQ